VRMSRAQGREYRLVIQAADTIAVHSSPIDSLAESDAK